jgi:XamI restriction endonuclease
MSAAPQLQKPPVWTPDELERDRQSAVEIFRKQRVEEPLEIYGEAFDQRQGQFEVLLEQTVDLTELGQHAIDILTTPHLRDALRYIAGPPISEDDLKTLAEAQTFTKARLHADPAMAKRFIDTVVSVVDVRRFPWLSRDGQHREPTEVERDSAILASAAIIATRDAEKMRRSQSKEEQEQQVEDGLLSRQFTKVATRNVRTLHDAPRPGEFCRESMVTGSKADFVIGLFDNRVMPLECKVSNSAVNSIKRLNREAARKAEVWRGDLGAMNCVPAAVLSGVYYHHMLLDAQNRGLTLFWAHSLDAQLLHWIDGTRPT